MYDAEARRMSKISHLKGRRGHQLNGKGLIFFNRKEKGETLAGDSLTCVLRIDVCFRTHESRKASNPIECPCHQFYVTKQQ